jgi:hypothetical protein
MSEIVSNKTVIIFNSAPNTGKDIAAKYLKDYFNGAN